MDNIDKIKPADSINILINRIKESENTIERNGKELLELLKKRDKAESMTDYNEIDIFWAERRIKDSKKELNVYRSIFDKLKWDIDYHFKKFT